MEQQQIHSLPTTFEGHAQQTDNGVDFWLARDLQHLLGYGKWDNFQSVISKAKTACEISGHNIADHFADVGKMVDLGSGRQREIDDVMLTRYACYLIAQNGDQRHNYRDYYIGITDIASALWRVCLPESSTKVANLTTETNQTWPV